MLDRNQIERYSRQIIVTGFGGTAQERLLSARLLVAGDGATLASALAYLGGAGVGALELHPTGLNRDRVGLLGARIRTLNPEVTVDAVAEPGSGSASVDGALIAISDRPTFELADRLVKSRWPGRGVLAWIGEAARVAVFADAPPCPACARPPLISGFKPHTQMPRHHAADLLVPETDVVMALATTEVLKLLAGIAPQAPAFAVEFDGYDTRRQKLDTSSPGNNCSCRDRRYRRGGNL